MVVAAGGGGIGGVDSWYVWSLRYCCLRCCHLRSSAWVFRFSKITARQTQRPQAAPSGRACSSSVPGTAPPTAGERQLHSVLLCYLKACSCQGHGRRRKRATWLEFKLSVCTPSCQGPPVSHIHYTHTTHTSSAVLLGCNAPHLSIEKSPILLLAMEVTCLCFCLTINE